MDELIISYDGGYNNWYVSEFYKYFHKKFQEQVNVNLKYIPTKDLAKYFGKEVSNHSSSIFNWYNLILLNPKNERFFIHSWYDYAPEIIDYSIENNFDISKFSCVSNLTEDIIQKYKSKMEVQPSVYYLENWSDIGLVNKHMNLPKKIDKVYFNGLIYGHREKIIEFLKTKKYFTIKTKTNPNEFQSKTDYYNLLSAHKFGLSLNGAANICYRDLELFGLGVINLRQPLKSMTYNPIIKDVHYIEFLTDNLVDSIINDRDVNQIIDLEIERLLDTSTEYQLKEMIFESKNWFNQNCQPQNQFEIIKSFMNELEIFR